MATRQADRRRAAAAIVAGAALVRSRTGERHQASQAVLGGTIAGLIAHAWSTLLDPHDLKGSTPRLVAAVEAIVTHYGRAAAAHALATYRIHRIEAGVPGQPPRLPMPSVPSTSTPGRPNLNVPAVPTRGEIKRVVEDAVHELYGPVTPEIEQKAQDDLAAEVEQLVLNQGRRATMDATEIDKTALGWTRVPEADACSFCALLATRGPVYKSTSFVASNAKFVGGKSEFKVHNNCRCNIEPVFDSWEPSAQVRQWQADYKDLTKTYGKSGRDILIAWRQHVEGRPVTGPLTKPYTRTK